MDISNQVLNSLAIRLVWRWSILQVKWSFHYLILWISFSPILTILQCGGYLQIAYFFSYLSLPSHMIKCKIKLMSNVKFKNIWSINLLLRLIWLEVVHKWSDTSYTFWSRKWISKLCRDKPINVQDNPKGVIINF
jgi:hypothetical protein